MASLLDDSAQQSSSTPDQASLFNYPIHLVTPQRGIKTLDAAITTGQNFNVVTLNPEMIMRADNDPDLAAIIHQANLVIPDGAGVVWALKTRGLSVKRLPGIEFSDALLQRAQQQGYRVAIVGAEESILNAAVSNLKQRYPQLQLVFTHHGFFNAQQRQQVATACAAQKPQVVLVALGVPRQEKWIQDFRDLFTGTAFVGIGGSLDVWSGKAKRAPKLMQRFNLEWLYRIISEPHRIARVYKTLPMFVVKVLTSPSSPA